MVSDERDELIERIAGRLRPLPAVDPAAKARVLVAVAAERERDRERAARRRPLVRWLGAAVVAATLVSALMLGRDRATSTAAGIARSGQPPALDTRATGTPAATLTRRDESASARQPVQLVFRAPNAKQVSVVGDFTGWDPTRAVMTRDSGSGLWTVTLSLPAGRHVYAFVVDDSVWVRDPRAPAAPDADFGRPGSVLLVGRP